MDEPPWHNLSIDDTLERLGTRRSGLTAAEAAERLGGAAYARSMLFTSIVLHAFTRVMAVRQLDELTLRSNRTLLWSYVAAVGLQLLALYTPLRVLFGVVALDWRAWAVMIPVVAGSTLDGIYMTRWILRRVPLWEETEKAT